MARAIQNIRKDLQALGEIVANLAVDLREIYAKYINFLGESVKKQLALASYYICTQAYPQAFLNLSFNERQKFQDTLRNLGNKYKTRLLSYLENPHNLEHPTNLNIMEKMLRGLPNQEEQTLDLTAITEEQARAITNPDELLHWYKNIENGILETLDNLSREANYCLQKSHILPDRLPSQLLDMAIQAEEAGQPVTGLPNLLNVLVETGSNNKEESEDDEEDETEHRQPRHQPNITKVVAIHLRLTEIEFADANLSLHRSQVRNLLEKLSKIRQQYHKFQRECAIAEAEAAWRASWHD
jgi:hypothetical protein